MERVQIYRLVFYHHSFGHSERCPFSHASAGGGSPQGRTAPDTMATGDLPRARGCCSSRVGSAHALNARSPLAGRAYGCIGRGCEECGFPVSRSRNKPAGISFSSRVMAVKRLLRYYSV